MEEEIIENKEQADEVEENIEQQPTVETKKKEKVVKSVSTEDIEKSLKGATITSDKQNFKTIKTSEGIILGYMKDARYGVRFYLLTGNKEALIQLKTKEDVAKAVSFVEQIQKQIKDNKITFKDGDFESTKKAEIVKHLLG